MVAKGILIISNTYVNIVLMQLLSVQTPDNATVSNNYKIHLFHSLHDLQIIQQMIQNMVNFVMGR